MFAVVCDSEEFLSSEKRCWIKRKGVKEWGDRMERDEFSYGMHHKRKGTKDWIARRPWWFNNLSSKGFMEVSGASGGKAGCLMPFETGVCSWLFISCAMLYVNWVSWYIRTVKMIYYARMCYGSFVHQLCSLNSSTDLKLHPSLPNYIEL